MKTVELYARVRHAVLIEGISERAAADRFGINARTVSKMLKFSVPPGRICRKFRVRAITMEKKETSYGETEATGYFRRAA